MKFSKFFLGFLSLGMILMSIWACQKDESLSATTNALDNSSSFALAADPGDESTNPCYKLVFPLEVKLADGSKVTVNSQEELDKLHRRASTNPRAGRPQILFPYDVILRNGDQVTVNGPEDLAKILRACNKRVNPDPGEHQCYVVLFPMTFALPDSTTVTVASKDELEAFLKNWQASGNTGRPQLSFPYNVKLKDGSELTINNEDDLKKLQELCRKGRNPVDPKPRSCFEYQFPLNVKLANGDLVTVNNVEELNRALAGRPTAGGRSQIVFPFQVKLVASGEVVTIENETDLRKLQEKCKMR
jgi:hypothetical protein